MSFKDDVMRLFGMDNRSTCGQASKLEVPTLPAPEISVDSNNQITWGDNVVYITPHNEPEQEYEVRYWQKHDNLNKECEYIQSNLSKSDMDTIVERLKNDLNITKISVRHRMKLSWSAPVVCEKSWGCK